MPTGCESSSSYATRLDQPPAELAAGEPGSASPHPNGRIAGQPTLIKLTAAQQDFADWKGDGRCPEISDAPYTTGPRKVQHR